MCIRDSGQLVGLGMALDRHDLAHHHAAELRARGRVGLDLEPGHGEPFRQFATANGRIAKGPEPALGDVHENWERKRRSPSKNRRRSSMPWRSMVRRSRPEPNANPMYLSLIHISEPTRLLSIS